MLVSRLLALRDEFPGVVRVLEVAAALEAAAVPGDQLFFMVEAEPLRVSLHGEKLLRVKKKKTEEPKKKNFQDAPKTALSGRPWHM